MDTDLFTVKSTKTLKVSRFTVIDDELDIQGQAAQYSFIEIKPGICVIIKTGDKYVLLKEYRYPIKQWTYEFAAGIIDDGEQPVDAAKREVEEETGYVADKITELGEFYPSFGATNEVIHLFFAECSEKHREHREYTEFITYELAEQEKIEELIANGEFKHGAGLAAWLKYRLYTEGLTG